MMHMQPSLLGDNVLLLMGVLFSSLGIKFPSNCSKIHLSPPDRNQGTLD